MIRIKCRRMGIARLILLSASVFASTVYAQAPLSNACQTQRGICMAAVAPVGAPCYCYAPGRPPDEGRMVFTPRQVPQAGPPQAQQQNVSAACGTRNGVCQVPVAAPVGSPCTCGRDPGQIIIFK